MSHFTKLDAVSMLTAALNRLTARVGPQAKAALLMPDMLSKSADGDTVPSPEFGQMLQSAPLFAIEQKAQESEDLEAGSAKEDKELADTGNHPPVFFVPHVALAIEPPAQTACVMTSGNPAPTKIRDLQPFIAGFDRNRLDGSPVRSVDPSVEKPSHDEVAFKKRELPKAAAVPFSTNRSEHFADKPADRAQMPKALVHDRGLADRPVSPVGAIKEDASPQPAPFVAHGEPAQMRPRSSLGPTPGPIQALPTPSSPQTETPTPLVSVATIQTTISETPAKPLSAVPVVSRPIDLEVLLERRVGPIKTLQIRLDPAELGMVTARIRLTSQGIDVHLVADKVDTARVLAIDSALLDKALRFAGVDEITKISVTVQERGQVPAITQSSGAAFQHGSHQPGQQSAPSQGQQTFNMQEQPDGLGYPAQSGSQQQRGNSGDGSHAGTAAQRDDTPPAHRDNRAGSLSRGLIV